MIGRTYLERGIPVVVLARWRKGAKGPRNVLIQRADGTKVVRPFRGLRRRHKLGHLPEGRAKPKKKLLKRFLRVQILITRK
jgi:acetyl esterase